MGLGKFKLEKLTLMGFESAERTKVVKSTQAMFNPTTLKQSYGIKWSCRQGVGASGKEHTYQRTDPARLDITLLLDGTGVDQMGIFILTRKTVSDRIQEFMDVAYSYNGEIHQPNFLLLQWGKFSFPCRLKTVDITYKLFNRDGTPLRAELAVALLSDESFENLAKTENKSSPDLTHARTVRQGDTLPLLTREIYGSSTHYLRVARFNGLDHPLDLTTGQVLRFPPLVQLIPA